MEHFAHLRVHSEYSIDDGLMNVKTIVKAAKARGISALALTDRFNGFGWVKFYQAAVAEGIKPILGADILVQTGSSKGWITLLVHQQSGFAQLSALLTQGCMHQDAYRVYNPNTWDADQLTGLILITGYPQSDLSQCFKPYKAKVAKERLRFWQQRLPDRCYLGFARHKRPLEQRDHQHLLALSSESSWPLVITHGVCFLDRKDYKVHGLKRCVQQGVRDYEEADRDHYTQEQYLLPAKTACQLYRAESVAIDNTMRLVERCTVKLDCSTYHFPSYVVPKSSTVVDSFQVKIQQGLQARLTELAIAPSEHKTYQSRLDHESQIIQKMGFCAYFLILGDIVSWAKKNEIPVGPGRGSGVGSLVAFSLGITDINPLPHDLLFERFLNPARVSMPDIDLDFCMMGRDRLIQYVTKQYGADRVAQIATFGTMAAKAVVRDVGRVLGYAYGFVDGLAKLVPMALGMTLSRALEENELLQSRYQTDPEVHQILDIAMQLEGSVRHVGRHAGGIVIAPKPLEKFTPLYQDPDQPGMMTQFDKDDLESLGLVKFDFLGLKTLTILDWTRQQIVADGQPFEWSKLPMDDKPVFSLIQKGNTTSVFQLESHGMRNLITRLKPDCFDDLVALVALFRPGPLEAGMAKSYVERKHGHEKVEYLHPDLEPILKPTYGVIVYQEQVMKIAQAIGNYTQGEADLLRRAMGKKKPEAMAKEAKKFVSGAVKHGVKEAVAQDLFDQMAKFAGYAFNKSHSVAYALLSYQTAWCKANHPAFFMAAVLSADMSNTDKIAQLVYEVQKSGIAVSPPSLLNCNYYFAVESGVILYGLGAIKGLGEAVIECLVDHRSNAPFTNLLDVTYCLAKAGKLNRKALEVLCHSGALDHFKVSRSVLFASIDQAIHEAERQVQESLTGQQGLWGQQQTFQYISTPDYLPLNQLYLERQALGYYFSAHPMSTKSSLIKALNVTAINRLKPQKKPMRLSGLVIMIRTLRNKKGQLMASALVDDGHGRQEVTIMPELYDQIAKSIKKNTLVLIEGQVAKDRRNNQLQCIANHWLLLDDVDRQLIQCVTICLQQGFCVQQDLASFKKAWESQERGDIPVELMVYINDRYVTLSLGQDWYLSGHAEQIKSGFYALPMVKSIEVIYQDQWQFPERSSY
ncbi:DNA polymerase III subunit alpha [Gammaproteobacteria bacterium]|nr:DNA polymerase III subunit alpha [Gammaproteobacteria bacterium]